jgi:hypothetical protein
MFGAACTPGTPGKENKSVNEGSDVGAEGWAVALCTPLKDSETPFSGVGWPGTCGVIPLTS